MSKSVTNSQVEDVLSSIRRLVSDTRENGQKSSVAPVQDKLLLTPQLRVSEDTPAAMVTIGDEGAREGTCGDGPLQLSEDVAVGPHGTPRERDEPASGDDAPGAAAAEGGFVFSHRGPVTADQKELSGDADQTPGGQVASSGLSAKIAALEAAIGRTADQWEPDGNGRDAYAGTPDPSMDWQDGVSFDGKGAPLSDDDPIEPVATAQGGADGDWPEEDQVIDEAALRLLVGDIVRSELQGELGERITRNIRKLVHREIMRALAAKELD